MEILQHGTEFLQDLAVLSCCWPPATETEEFPTTE